MKRYRVIVSDQAKQSLRSIVRHIAAESPSAANYVRKSLIDLMRTLDRSPEKYSAEEYLQHKKGNYRSVTKWHYKIVYVVKTREVIILDVIHTGRNPEVIRKIR